jgi:hypothetical protein
VFAPSQFKRVLVWPSRVTGKPKNWEVQLTDTLSIQSTGLTSLPAPNPFPEGVSATNSSVSVNGKPGLYVERDGGSRELYFEIDMNIVMVVDRAPESDFESFAAIASSLIRSDP